MKISPVCLPPPPASLPSPPPSCKMNNNVEWGGLWGGGGAMKENHILPYTAEAMAIFPTYLAASSLLCLWCRSQEEIVQPGGESIIPMPRRAKSGATRRRLHWLKIKIRVPLRSARSHPPSSPFLFFWDVSHPREGRKKSNQIKQREKNSTIFFFFLSEGFEEEEEEEGGTVVAHPIDALFQSQLLINCLIASAPRDHFQFLGEGGGKSYWGLQD